MCAGHPGFGFRAGRVWGVHLAWSGNQVLSAEHSFTGWRLLRGGELLLPGEVRLEPARSTPRPGWSAPGGTGSMPSRGGSTGSSGPGRTTPTARARCC